MTFRRGFKKEAEQLSADTREEMGLSLTDRLDPFALASHLAIPVHTVEDLLRFAENSALVRRLLGKHRDSFSAMTLFMGYRRIIIHNETHAQTRQASNIAHEIAHCLLEHPPAKLVGRDGCRYWHSQFEKEANWLAGALLVPREGALSLRQAGVSLQGLSIRYGVSHDLVRWRINQTGIALQIKRTKKMFGRSR